MSLAIRQDDTALAVVRLDPTSRQSRPATDPVQKTPLRTGQVLNGQRQNGQMVEANVADEVRALIGGYRLDEATRIVATLLNRRIADGDSELGAASMLLQHYDTILSRQPPLSHIGTVPLRPNECLYACFDQFIDLIRRQQSQVSELQAIIAELI